MIDDEKDDEEEERQFDNEDKFTNTFKNKANLRNMLINVTHKKNNILLSLNLIDFKISNLLNKKETQLTPSNYRTHDR